VNGGADRVTGVSVVLFDFFGTLASYEPDRSLLAYPMSHELAGSFGYTGDHDRFVIDWHAASSALESATAESHVEFSMTDAASAFSDRCGLGLTIEQSSAMGECFVREWQAHVVPVPGAAEMLRRLADSFRLGVVSNTHHSAMVPEFLAGMGVAEVMSLVVLSVDHGFRKPHPSIYERCLGELGVAPSEVLFVGDSLPADYEAPLLVGMDAVLIADDPVHAVVSDRWVRSVLDVEALFAR
jgi:putative hydrolase of the HAD superfamily